MSGMSSKRAGDTRQQGHSLWRCARLSQLRLTPSCQSAYTAARCTRQEGTPLADSRRTWRNRRLTGPALTKGWFELQDASDYSD
jgi:hypothetical protein